MKRAWAAFRGWPTWAQWVAGIVLAVVVIGAAAGGEDEDTQTVTAGQPATTALITSTTPSNTSPPTTARPTTTAAPPPPTTAAGPRTTFGNGQYRVGTDIAPGTYVAPGGTACYWERQSTFGGGGVDSIIANDLSTGGQVVVTILASDRGFSTRGCGTWTPG